MSLSRYAKRRDANESEIVAAARDLGALMEPLDRPVDWLCGWKGRWYPVEIKVKKGRYTDAQGRFLTLCALDNLPVWTWRSVDDAIKQLRETK